MKLSVAQQYGKKIVDAISPHCLPGMCMVVGSTRREKAEPGDLEILCCPDLSRGYPKPEFGRTPFFSYLDKSLYDLCQAGILTATNKGTILKKFIIPAIGAKLQIFVVVAPELWGVQAVVRTGPSEFSNFVVTPRSMRGALPDGHRIADGWITYDPMGNIIPFTTELAFLEFLGLGWIEPSKREAHWGMFGNR